jgi:chromosome partitioning protein
VSIVCVANSKGGTGKTSVSLNLIHHLLPDLIIDADVHRGISNLLSLGDNSIEVRHAKTKQDIINWTKSDKLILIDCGGFDSDITRYAISQADQIITPTTDDPTDQFALIEFNKLIRAVSQMVNEKLTAQIILNRVHHSRTEFKDLDKLLSELEHLDRSPITIPQSALIPKSAFKGKAVLTGNVASKFSILAKYIKKNM